MTYEKKAPTGAGVFIWQPSLCEGGDWQKIIAKALANKISWVVLHNFYSQASIIQLKEAGLYVAYSQYCTPTNASNVVTGASNAMAAGADGILLDMEIEWEGTSAVPYAQKRDAAIAMFTKLRTAVGDAWLGNAGAWAYPKSHPSYPDTIIARYVDAALPERYWTEQTPGMAAKTSLDNSERQWVEYPDVKGYKSIIPIGSGYGMNTTPAGGHQPLDPADFKEFVDRQDTFAIWSWLHMPGFAWDVLKTR